MSWKVCLLFLHALAHLTLGLLKAGLDDARSRGARIVEGYPVEPGRLYTYMGSPATLRNAGFRDVDQVRRTVRCDLY